MRVLKKVPIHPTFYLIIIWYVLSGRIFNFLVFTIVLAIHEYGHYYVSKKLGYTLERFYIAPYGACLNYKEKQFERSDEIKIAIAGPIANVFSALVCIAFWWISPNVYMFTYSFVEESLMLGIFNLLPAYPLDGGRILTSILAVKVGRNKAVKYVKLFNVIFSIVFLALFILSFFFSFNPSFALMIIFLMSGFLQGDYASKYKNSFLFDKKLKQYSKPRQLLVCGENTFLELLKKIENDSYTIFTVVSNKGEVILLTEKQVVEFCIKYNPKGKLSVLFER